MSLVSRNPYCDSAFWAEDRKRLAKVPMVNPYRSVFMYVGNALKILFNSVVFWTKSLSLSLSLSPSRIHIDKLTLEEFIKQSTRKIIHQSICNITTCGIALLPPKTQWVRWLVNKLHSGTYIICWIEYLCNNWFRKTSLVYIIIYYWKSEQHFLWLVNKFRLWILRWIWDQAYLFLLGMFCSFMLWEMSASIWMPSYSFVCGD